MLLQLFFRSLGAGSLITSGIDAGSMLNTLSNDEDFVGRDRQMKETCCGEAQQCHLYYERRPSHSCIGYEPPVRSECHACSYFTLHMYRYTVIIMLQ